MKVFLISCLVLGISVAVSHGQRRYFTEQDTASWVSAGTIEPKVQEVKSMDETSFLDEAASSSLPKSAGSSSSALTLDNKDGKPEAFLVHLRPKAGGNNKSKFLLLLRLPDGSTETIETTNPEGLASAATNAQSSLVPEAEESRERDVQQKDETDFGFEDQQREAAPVSAFTGETASQHQQHHINDENDAHELQQHRGADAFDEQQREQASPLEQQRDTSTSYGPSPSAAPIVQQTQDDSSYGSSSGAAAPLRADSYSAPAERNVPVLLIALPPEASPFAHTQRLNRIIAAMGQRHQEQVRDTSDSFAPSTNSLSSGTKGGNIAAAPVDNYSTKGQSGALSSPSGYGSPASAAAAQGPAYGDASSAPLNNQNFGTKGSRLARPKGRFGGYGNSHTPSPAGGYGSLAMRLSDKGIPAPTKKEVKQIDTLKNIISQAKSPVHHPAALKGRSPSVQQYASPADALKAVYNGPSNAAQSAPLNSGYGAPAAQSASRSTAGTKGGRSSAAPLTQQSYDNNDAQNAPLTRPSSSYNEDPRSGRFATKGGSAAPIVQQQQQLNNNNYDAPRPAQVAQAQTKGQRPEPQRQGVSGEARKAPSRLSPAQAAKGQRQRSSPSVPAYASSVDHEVTRPLFDDEATEGLPSRFVTNGGYQKEDVAARESDPVSSAVPVPHPAGAMETGMKVGGRRMVLLLFNKGELNAHDFAESAIARAGL